MNFKKSLLEERRLTALPSRASIEDKDNDLCFFEVTYLKGVKTLATGGFSGTGIGVGCAEVFGGVTRVVVEP
jgi:hypothetical protein